MAALTDDDIKLAEDMATQVINDTFGSIDSLELPVDLNAIIEKYGLKLKKGEFVDDNISGAFDRQSSTIYVSENESPTRQNFTVAHELGHYKLHKDVKTDILYRTQVFQFDSLEKHETVANWFAASLLMPEAAIIRLWKTSKDINKLADIFGVSKHAMYFRLKNLHLLS